MVKIASLDFLYASLVLSYLSQSLVLGDSPIPADYNLMDPDPYCKGYDGLCVTNNAGNDGIYTSIRDRQMLAIHNVARQGPSEFLSHYVGNGLFTFSCEPGTSAPPSEWESNLSQAAKKESEMMTKDGCSFSHYTCSSYTYLFGGRTDVSSRVWAYNTRYSGEIIYGTSGTGKAINAMKAWFKSSGHCSIIFNSKNTRAGYAYYLNRATGDFNQLEYQYNNPIKSGSHLSEKIIYDYTVTDGYVHFIASYYSTSTSVVSATVIIDGVSTAMSLITGSTTNGGYAVDAAVSGTSCSRYYFQFVDSNGDNHRLPETGNFILNDFDGSVDCDIVDTFEFFNGTVIDNYFN
eukprot:Pgem_evm1s5887